MFEPPPGYVDFASDAEDAAEPTGRFRDLLVDDVGVVSARKPIPRSASNLAAAWNSKASGTAQLAALKRFVQSHLADGEWARLIAGMEDGQLPADSVELVARAVATWGTARPTRPSSRCA